MKGIGALMLLVVLGAATFVIVDSSSAEFKKSILEYLKLDESATAADICNGFQRILEADLERQRENGGGRPGAGTLPESDPNHMWINACKDPNLTLDSLWETLKAIQRRIDESFNQ